MLQKFLTIISIALSLSSCANAQKNYTNDKPAYVIYNKEGKQVNYTTLLNGLKQGDVVLFGEQHNDPISHWLELSLLKDLHQEKRNITLGSEIWESDQQIIIDEFIEDKEMSMKSFLEYTRQWPNFTTDYKAMLQYAKDHSIPVLASNVPRRYSSLVSTRGIAMLDSISEEAKSFLPPLPLHIDLTQEFYDEDVANVFKQVSMMNSSSISNLVKAQALKDATMAYHIVESCKKNQFVYHFNGEMHSAKHAAIVYYISHYNKDIDVKTVSVLKQKDIHYLEEANKRADFVVVVPNDMTVSYE